MVTAGGVYPVLVGYHLPELYSTPVPYRIREVRQTADRPAAERFGLVECRWKIRKKIIIID